MLQQTQVDRVIPKFALFLKQFPSFRALAAASQADVIRSWQGLGYNRRAINLHRSAGQIVQEHKGHVPKDTEALLTLPGVGPYTASALRAFIYNIPDVLIETNVRSAYLRAFFPGDEKVSDRELFPLIAKTIDTKNPREWYYALMDYGAMQKRTIGNESRRSAHYSKQSVFKGSARQIRGRIVAALSKHASMTTVELVRACATPKARVEKEITRLIAEGFIVNTKGYFSLR